MDWSAPVDLYCERTSAWFWAEPLNALTNAAFLVSAVLAFTRWRRAGANDGPTLALITVLASIGLGSFAFHTLATQGAVLLDVIPIAIFVHGYFAVALHRFLGVPWNWVARLVVAFFVASQMVALVLPSGLLNGSIGYLPALLAMLAIGLLASRGLRRALLICTALFAVSLTFRTIDLAICGYLPLGTHFIWHVLNAVVLFRLLVVAMPSADRSARSA